MLISQNRALNTKNVSFSISETNAILITGRKYATLGDENVLKNLYISCFFQSKQRRFQIFPQC